MKTTLEILNNVQVASPCSASWDDMIGDDFSRFCNQCDKNVYNLSALTAEAAIQLVREKEGNLCGRFFRRADGTLLTADCPVGVNHRIPRKHKWAVLAASLAGLLSLGGCGRIDDSTGSSTESPPAKQELTPAVNDTNNKPANRRPEFLGKLCPPALDLPPRAGEPMQTEVGPVPREAAPGKN